MRDMCDMCDMCDIINLKTLMVRFSICDTCDMSFDSGHGLGVIRVICVIGVIWYNLFPMSQSMD